MTKDAKSIDYDRSEATGRESISRLLLRFSGPAIIASETFAFYNLFDAIWCGRLAAEALAALSVANPLMAIYRAIGAGIGVGATSLIARNLGAGKKEETNRIACCSVSSFFIVFSLCIGLGQGMLPLVGYNFGAQKKERVGEVVVKAGLISFIWGALCWVVVTLFPTQVISLFGTDANFLAGGTSALSLFALGFFTMGLQNNLSSFFQGIWKGIPSLIVASSRDLIFLIPCLLIMPSIFGITGLWAAYPIANTLSVVLTLTWAAIIFRSLRIPFRLRSTSSDL